jgi:hypothetical protein
MDDEITGMFQIAKILDGMDEETQARVVRWAADKYGIDLGQAAEQDEGIDTGEQVMIGGVDPEKLAAAKAAKEAARAEEQAAPKLEVKPASTMESTEAPPERDPEKPSFLDTSFRMYSGKQILKKEKETKD